ncbi:MAG: hypothetical protein AAB250_13135 [Bdellovibrionota bacterium]
MNELESREADVFSRSVDERGRVRTFLSDSISFGGFFETALTGLSGADTPPQVSAHSNTLGLNVTANYSEKMRFVSQLLTGLTYVFTNPHNDFRATTPQRQFTTPLFGSLVAQAYSEMLVEQLFNLQIGLGYVPYGHAFQQREPVLLRRRGGPQLGQAGSASSPGIAHPLWMGFHLHGSKSVDASKRWGYNAYSFSPVADTKSLGVGGRTWTTIDEKTTYGFSVQSGSMKGGSFTSYGVDIDRYAEWGGFRAEYARNFMSDGTKLAESFYVEPHYNFRPSRLIGFVTADYLDNPFNTTSPTATSDPIMKWIYGAGLNWLPISFARFRLGVFAHRYVGTSEFSGSQRRDYESYELSSGIAF